MLVTAFSVDRSHSSKMHQQYESTVILCTFQRVGHISFLEGSNWQEKQVAGWRVTGDISPLAQGAIKTFHCALLCRKLVELCAQLQFVLTDFFAEIN